MDEEERKKRIDEFNNWLGAFQEAASKRLQAHNDGFEYDKSSAALNLVDDYMNILERAKKHLPDNHRINVFKIIAGTQAVILKNQPFSLNSQDSDGISDGIRRLNAKFAWRTSVNILTVEKLKPHFSTEIINDFFGQDEVNALFSFHLDWCERLTINSDAEALEIPYFLMAQFWQAIHGWFCAFAANK